MAVRSDVVADLSYWNAGWGPVRPMQFDGNCGIALVSRGMAYRASPDEAVQEVGSFYFWRVKRFTGKADSTDLKRSWPLVSRS
jgi:hypothetical protein